MRKADTVLGIIRDRGMRGLPLEDVYRQLYNPHLYIRAYDRLRTNQGALTPGVTGETVDGMSTEKIAALIDALRHERYRWTPVKRVYIPKKNGKLRPLGLPTWSDKLLGDVVRSILEAYYEPQFSDHSHGFRPNRGCHTALTVVQRTWTGTRWLIEGDLAQCFDRLDHTVLLSILSQKLHDQRFLRLIATMLKAGYLEDWRWHATLSGAPQGGVASPILSNIYLDQLDWFVERHLLPAYNRGEARQKNPAYVTLCAQIRWARRKGDWQRAHVLEQQRRTLPSQMATDPAYRRLRYIRYADDFLLGFVGPKAEAQDIKTHLRDYLRDTLKLELSEDKTLITHAVSTAAHFLGYDIGYQQSNDKICAGRRSVNGHMGLRVPKDAIDRRCRRYMDKGKPERRAYLIHESDFAIVLRYQAEYRGVVQYYQLATNIAALGRLHYVMETSLLKTLANKHKATVTAMARKYRATADTPYGPMTCLRVQIDRTDKPALVAEFGGIPLRVVKTARTISDTPPEIWTKRTDIVDRLLADRCELCGQEGRCEVHHIRKMADLHRKGRKDKPAWMQRMSAMRRKTLVVCPPCHDAIHAGRLQRQGHTEEDTGEPCNAKVLSTVQREADGKVPAC